MDGFIPVSFCNLTKTAEVACATKCISKNLLLFYFHQNLLHKTNHHLSCDPCLESVDHVFTVCNLCFSKGGLLAGEEVVSGVGEGVGGGWSEVFSEIVAKKMLGSKVYPKLFLFPSFVTIHKALFYLH